MLSTGEAELLWLLVDAADQGRPMRIASPGRAARLATLCCVVLATRQLTHPGVRQPSGPVALVGAGPVHRQLLAGLAIGEATFVGSLGIVRLRRDGRVQRFAGGEPRSLQPTDRVVIVSNRVGLPDSRPFGPVVIDEAAAGNSYDLLHEWAIDRGGLVHVVAPLAPGAGVGGFVADWPLIASERQRWPPSYRAAWGSCPKTTIHPVSPEPPGLASARVRLAEVARATSAAWPEPLSNAAALTRQLAGLTVPVEDYDAHTRGTIAAPIAERAEQLRATRSSDLAAGWRGFAETGWAPLKLDILAALDDLESHNPKSDALGLLVEELLHSGETVQVWLDNGVHARTLADHLVSAGFAIDSEHIDAGLLRIAVFGDAAHDQAAGTSVVSGLPAPWQLARLVAGDFGGPLHVMSYPFEHRRLKTVLGWVVNSGRLEHAHERAAVYRMLLGEVSCPPSPAPVVSETLSTATLTATEYPVGEWGTDAAEFAALADDEWLAALPGETGRSAERCTGEIVSVRALLVEPGPCVVLVRPGQLVDRIVGGRVRPTPGGALTTGMTILGLASDGQSLFDRLRPHLDRIHGPGTGFWLEQWDDALRAAANKSGGAAALARALIDVGATITSSAVAGWASPYRIGPRDPDNVGRVAQVADHALVAHHNRRVAAVMRGVRIEHHRLGRALARSIRHHAAGDVDAFDEIEERLGIDAATVIGDVDTYTVKDDLGSGTAESRATGRLLTLAEARDLFTPEEQST
jgi:hypothetical protein